MSGGIRVPYHVMLCTYPNSPRGQTNTCENIAFPQVRLPAVIKYASEGTGDKGHILSPCPPLSLSKFIIVTMATDRVGDWIRNLFRPSV